MKADRPLRLSDPGKREQAEAEEEENGGPPGWKRALWDILKDVLVAAIIMVLIIGTMYGYTGNWPPLVVVQSGSMMHGADSSLGVIDTGDLVMVKEINSRDDIITYIEGQQNGHETYGSYGDVVVYRKNGQQGTPVIHRALMWVELNSTTGNTFDLIELNHNQLQKTRVESIYNVSRQAEGVREQMPLPSIYNVGERVNFGQYGWDGRELVIDFKIVFEHMLETSYPDLHGGLLTKGDGLGNPDIDQQSLPEYGFGGPPWVTPLKEDWIVGKARGELPWFGLIKLYMGGDINEQNTAPESSKKNLTITLVILIVVPIIIDYINDRRRKKKEEMEDDDEEREVKRGGKKPKERGGRRDPWQKENGPPPERISGRTGGFGRSHISGSNRHGDESSQRERRP